MNIVLDTSASAWDMYIARRYETTWSLSRGNAMAANSRGPYGSRSALMNSNIAEDST